MTLTDLAFAVGKVRSEASPTDTLTELLLAKDDLDDYRAYLQVNALGHLDPDHFDGVPLVEDLRGTPGMVIGLLSTTRMVIATVPR